MGSGGGGGLGSPSQAVTANPWPQRAAVPWEGSLGGGGGGGQAACGARGQRRQRIPAPVERRRRTQDGARTKQEPLCFLPAPSAFGGPSPGAPWEGHGTGPPTPLGGPGCALSVPGQERSVPCGMTPPPPKKRSPQRRGLPAQGQTRNPKSRLGAAPAPSHRGIAQDAERGHSRTRPIHPGFPEHALRTAGTGQPS